MKVSKFPATVESVQLNVLLYTKHQGHSGYPRTFLAMSCSYAPKDQCIKLGGKSKDEGLCRTKYSVHTPCSIQMQH